MPCFLIPIHEFNEFNWCHEPSGSPVGGQFCGKGTGGRDYNKAMLIRPGQDFDLLKAAAAGHSGAPRKTRRFLLNPTTGELVIGGAVGIEGRDASHAEAFDNALLPPETFVRGPNWTMRDTRSTEELIAHGKRYDQFTIHGHIGADAVPDYAPELRQIVKPPTRLRITIDRIIGTYPEQIDLLFAMAQRFVAMGAPADTPVLAHTFGGETTLGRAFPELFGKPKRRARKRAA